MEIKHVLEHENGNTTYQNLGDAAKAVLRKYHRNKKDYEYYEKYMPTN